jgi:hypothetical protein
MNNKTKTIIILLIVAAIIASAGFIIAQRLTRVANLPEPEGETGGVVDTRPNENENDENVMKVYYIDIENKRGVPTTIGCGDSMRYVTIDSPADMSDRKRFLETALGYLFSEKDQYVGKGGLYNSLYQSDLTLDKVEIENGTVKVFMLGNLRLGGVCDNPRAEQQIKLTATQIPGIMASELYLNGEPLTFSQQ